MEGKADTKKRLRQGETDAKKRMRQDNTGRTDTRDGSAERRLGDAAARQGRPYWCVPTARPTPSEAAAAQRATGYDAIPSARLHAAPYDCMRHHAVSATPRGAAPNGIRTRQRDAVRRHRWVGARLAVDEDPPERNRILLLYHYIILLYRIHKMCARLVVDEDPPERIERTALCVVEYGMGWNGVE